MTQLKAFLQLDAFQKFAQLAASSSSILLISAIFAFVWANSPWHESYHQLWHTPLALTLGEWTLNQSLHHWINDGLMAIFFFVVGLEIKRELLVGELSEPRQAMFPVMAALGGMLIPAIIYMGISPPGSQPFSGWGIPTVTDIAFALGVLAMLGDRVPLGLKVFLTALAIVDDLGAIVLISLFYSSEIHWSFLGGAGLILLVLFLLARLGMRRTLVYALCGLGVWGLMLFSGIHATLAGVLVAMVIPANAKISANVFCAEGLTLFDRIRHTCQDKEACSILTEKDYQESVQDIESLCEAAQAPLQQLEHTLNPWVSYLIMPLFALANAGVTLQWGAISELVWHPITVGIVLGLIIGKQIGITLFSWLSVKLNLATLPTGLSWRHIYGVSWLGGIGFTMSLFIANLAFTDPLWVDTAKVGILLASTLSGLLGYLVLNQILKAGAPAPKTVSP